jgi:hypothetical protein
MTGAFRGRSGTGASLAAPRSRVTVGHCHLAKVRPNRVVGLVQQASILISVDPTLSSSSCRALWYVRLLTSVLAGLRREVEPSWTRWLIACEQCHLERAPFFQKDRSPFGSSPSECRACALFETVPTAARS